MDIWCNRPVNTGAIFSVWLMTYIEESAEAVGIRDNWGLSLTVLFWSKVVTQIDFFRFREKKNGETFCKVKIVETFALCTIKKFTLYVFFHSGVFIYYSKWPNTVSFHPTHFMSSTFGSLTHFMIFAIRKYTLHRI